MKSSTFTLKSLHGRTDQLDMSNLILGSTQITSVELNWFKRRSPHVLYLGYEVRHMKSSTFEPGFTTQVSTTGTNSDLSRKVWVTAYKGDAYWAVNL